MGTPLDLSNVVRSFGAPRQFVRPGKVTYTNGVKSEAASTTVTLTAIVQPAGGRELEALPEGRRTEEFVRVDVLTPGLRSEDSAGPLLPADRFIDLGKTYEVWRESNWARLANFHSYLASRVEDA